MVMIYQGIGIRKKSPLKTHPSHREDAGSSSPNYWNLPGKNPLNSITDWLGANIQDNQGERSSCNQLVDYWIKVEVV